MWNDNLFWHQTIRKKLTKPVRCLTFTLFRLPRSSDRSHKLLRLFTRYLELLLVFLLSGILHQTVDVAQGLRWADGGAVRFFATMAAGIVVEDGVQWVAGRVWPTRPKAYERTGLGGIETENRVRKSIGYVWVLPLFSWATPVWAYPTLRRNTGAVADDQSNTVQSYRMVDTSVKDRYDTYPLIEKQDLARPILIPRSSPSADIESIDRRESLMEKIITREHGHVSQMPPKRTSSA